MRFEFAKQPVPVAADPGEHDASPGWNGRGARQFAPAVNQMNELEPVEISGAWEADQTNSLDRNRHKASKSMITAKSAAYKLKQATSFRSSRVP